MRDSSARIFARPSGSFSRCPAVPSRLQALKRWQASHGWLLEDADRVIAPSQDLARRLRAYFPALDPIVAAHLESERINCKPKLNLLKEKDKLRILLLGEMHPHKGYQILLECARLAQKHREPLEFSLVGTLVGDPLPNGVDLTRAGVWISGRYQDSCVHELIAQREPHLLWYPSLCPESYSYTLSTGLDSGLPIVVTDIGSFPERVAGRPWTWVCSWELAPIEWIEFFLRIREGNFLRNISPEVPVGEASPASDFYSTDYLLADTQGNRLKVEEPDKRSIAHFNVS